MMSSEADLDDEEEQLRIVAECPYRRAIRDNLRNFFLSPPAEMISFLQRLREAVEFGKREESAWDS